MIGKWEMVRLGDVSTGKVTNIAQKDLADNEGEYPIYGASGLIKHVDFYREEQPYIGVVKDGAGVGRTTLMPAQSSLIGTMQYILPNDNVDVGFCHRKKNSERNDLIIQPPNLTPKFVQRIALRIDRNDSIIRTRRIVFRER